MTRGRIVEIGPITREASAGGDRITALVDDRPVWFESSDAELAASAEAFVATFFVSALHQGARLRLVDPLPDEWRRNVARIAERLHTWWRYPKWTPEGPSDSSPPAAARRKDGAAALFFSAGVDSFHRLLRGRPVDWLVTIAGFDYRLDDEARAMRVETSLRQVAAATSTRPVIVRTNAREHPLVRDAPWPRVYGGVMAGIGHALAPAVRRMAISASAPGDWTHVPWGSHREIDPLWSSSRVEFTHDEAGIRRLDKLRSIASDPLTRSHLRVCWQNFAPTGNCGRCAKCLLAMAILEECGELGKSEVFPGRDPLLQGLRTLRKTPDRYHTFAEIARSPRLDPEIAAAVEGLVRRSLWLKRPDIRARRAAVKWWVTRGPFATRPAVSRS
jgi:hypothetical protein